MTAATPIFRNPQASINETYFWYGDSQFAPTVTVQPSAFTSYRQTVRGVSVVTVSDAAVPGTQTVDWLPGSSYFNTAVAQYQAAISAGSVPKAFMCSLGTNDSSNASLVDWQGNMATTIAALRSALGLNLPLIYTIVPPTPPSGSHPTWAGVRALQQSWTGGVGVQMPDGPYQVDGLHFDPTACAAIAQLLSAAVV